MKKDIQIPEVSNVLVAVVKEFNKEFQCEDWNAYIINTKKVDLEMILIVSKGYDEDKGMETAVLRHKIEKLPANSFAKIELIQNEVLKLTNFFYVTFFEGNTMFERKYIFEKGVIKEGNLRQISVLNKRGILAK